MEPTLVDAFKANPFFFLASTVLAVAAGVLALVALVVALKKPVGAIVLGAISIFVALGALGFGALGWTLAVSRVDGAASHPGLSDSDRERLTTYGYAEARYCLIHGALVSALPLLGGIAGVGLGVRRRKAPARAAD